MSGLDTIRITDVEAIYLRLPQIDARTDSSQDALIIRISTDVGITGYGEVDSCPLVVKAIVEAPSSHTLVTGLRDVLVGECPLDTTALWQKMYDRTIYYGRAGAVIHAMAGVDIALWDIKGKYLDQPIWRLLGGQHQRSLTAYASQLFGQTPEETAARAATAAAAGFTAVKFGWEPFGRDRDYDRALVAAAREGAGDKARLMVDAGLVWDAKTTIERCRMLSEYDVYFLEEPLQPGDLRGYRRVSAGADIRIAAGEEECTVDGFLRLFDEAHIDIAQIDVTRTGLTQAMQIAHAAQLRGIPCCNHSFTTDLNVAASAHFLTAIPNALMLEYSLAAGPIREGLTTERVLPVGGRLAAPNGPGLGVDLNPDCIAAFRVR